MSLPSIYKVNGYYYFTLNGRQRYGGKTLETAEAKVKKLQGEVVTKQSASQSGAVGLLLSIAGEEYFTHITGNQSEDTTYCKRLSLQQFIKRVGDLDVGLVTPLLIETWKKELLKTHKKNSIRTLFLRISPLFGYLVETKRLSENPFKKVQKLKVSKKPEPDALSDQEYHDLLKLCEKRERVCARDQMIIHLGMNTGLRRKEICNLQWTDISLERKLLTVRHGKGDKDRLIPINNTLYEVLLQYPRSKSGYVVTSEMGTKISRSTLTGIMKVYVKEFTHTYEGVKRLTLHSLRAGFATRIAISGKSPYIIQRLMGHTDLKTTLNYCRVQLDDMRNAVEC